MRFDAIVLGAGAAGLMCASVAGQRGRRVLLLDQADKVGKKILISRQSLMDWLKKGENYGAEAC